MLVSGDPFISQHLEPALMIDTSMVHLKVPRMTQCTCNPSLGQSEGCKEQFLQLLGEKLGGECNAVPDPSSNSWLVHMRTPGMGLQSILCSRCVYRQHVNKTLYTAGFQGILRK